MTRWVGVMGVMWALVGCSKPQPPTLTPKQGKLEAIGPSGVTLSIDFDGYNPNGFDLSVRSVRATGTFNNNVALREVTSAPGVVTLRAKATSPITLRVTIPWESVTAMAQLVGRASVPYQITGAVTVGGERLNVEVPFTLNGSVTQAELTAAGLNSLKNIPGLPSLPGLIP
ncbi:MAG: LEA type 2 family protein [Polyangiaceae bacterium]|nr:LEA type 2 family protein [Polyangiaceae bacterium]